jgi:hypothetical protein
LNLKIIIYGEIDFKKALIPAYVSSPAFGALSSGKVKPYVESTPV